MYYVISQLGCRMQTVSMRMRSWLGVFNTTVLVGALGYFVDIYDLVLFSIVRVDSLRRWELLKDRAYGQGRDALEYADGWNAGRRYHLGYAA